MREKLGPYRLGQAIGHGGAAQVHLAEDRRNGQTVALKILRADLRDHPAALEAFRREATVAATLSHPNLVSCIDAGVDDEIPWIAYELVKGTALPSILKRSGFLDPAWATNIVLDVAYGLAALHGTGVIHRDVKPANVLFSNDGAIKLIDFGAALEAENSGGSGTEVDMGWSGTLAYASPEQLQNRELDGRSDLYSLGLVFYEMLTGRRLVTASTRLAALAVHNRLFDEAAAPSSLRPDLPAELDTIVFALLEPFVEDRGHADALALVDALEELVAEHGWATEAQIQARRQARRELVETAYWQAKNALDTGGLDGALSTCERLLSLLRGAPDETVARRLAQDLLAVLGEADGSAVDDTLDLDTTKALMAILGRLSSLGKGLGSRLLRAVVARRALTLCERISDSKIALRLLKQQLARDPGSFALGQRCVELAEAMGQRDFASSLTGAMAVLALEQGWVSTALDLGSRLSDKDMNRRIVASCRTRNEARGTFRRVLEAFGKRGCTAEAVNIAVKYLRDDPGWSYLWKARIELHLELGETEEADRASLEAGVLALERGLLEEARRHFGRCLDWNGRNEAAWAGYHEASQALGCLPRGWESSRGCRMALLLSDGRERAVEGELEVFLAEGPSEETLRALVDLLPTGARQIRSRLSRELALHALLRAEGDEALELFAQAIRNAPMPEREHEVVMALPGLRSQLSLFERMGLRRAAGLDDEATSPGRPLETLVPVKDLGERGAMSRTDVEALGFLRMAS